jgi:GNAT superfamily N-acetyltransferase
MPGRLRIFIADTPEAIRRGWPVLRELRTHLADADDLVRRVTRQQRDGYRLALGETGGTVVTAAGFRVLENLISGRFLYVDDLVTLAAEHGRGWGTAMMAWVEDEARRCGCGWLSLDSGVHRFPAHRFYLGIGMDITSHHFGKRLDPVPDGPT